MHVNGYAFILTTTKEAVLQEKILFRVKRKSYISPSLGYSNATLFIRQHL